jgi:Na+/melibiose symporter-like transporter
MAKVLKTRDASSLKRRTLTAYGLPGLPLAVATLPFYVFIPALYSQNLGLSLAQIGTALLAVRLLDAVSDPVVGILSDRTKSRWGRRKPWLLVAMPALIFSVFMVFDPPADAGLSYLLFWSSVLTLAWTAAAIPYSAWGAELSMDRYQRTLITSAREGFVIVGTLIAAGVPFLLNSFGNASLSVHVVSIAYVVAIMLPLSIGAALLWVPEMQVTPAPRIAWRKGIAALKENEPFQKLISAYLINATANGIPATLFILFVTHRLEMPETYGLLLFLYFLSGLIGIPLWLRLSKRFGKTGTWCLAMMLAMAAFVWTPFVVGPGDIAVFTLITLISGIAVGADLALPPSIQADIIDIDFARTGHRRSGLYFALWGLATKLALGLAAGLSLPLLQSLGFNPQAEIADGTNSEASLFGLAAVYALLPVVLKAIAVKRIWTLSPLLEPERSIHTSLVRH